MSDDAADALPPASPTAPERRGLVERLLATQPPADPDEAGVHHENVRWLLSDEP